MNKRKLEDILDKLNIPVDIMGYKYWITALELYLKDNSVKKMYLYNKIAKIHKTTYTRVERALRHCCEINEKVIKEYFKIDYKITNSRFLALLAREMERENEML